MPCCLYQLDHLTFKCKKINEIFTLIYIKYLKYTYILHKDGL